ncbi:serine hydrolase domain-containing protein [soil metagenome]
MGVAKGDVAPGFEPVRAAFERCFEELGEEGASFAACHRGELVVDLYGGEIERDSLVNVYSVGKPLVAFCVLLLADRGLLDLSDPVAEYWPEFAQAGKAGVTVRQLLSHQAGIPALREPLPPEALFDWERLCAALAAEEPWFEPGTAHAEHVLLYGHLCGELVRRCDSRTLGTFWREEVARPWALDFAFGLDDAQLARALDLRGELDAPGTDLARQGLSNPPGARDLAVVNGEAWRRAEIPAVNGHSTAVALARFYSGLHQGGDLDGVRLVSPSTVAAMFAPQMTAVDPLLGEEMTWALGAAVDDEGWGMGGIGGSYAGIEPNVGTTEAYVTRTMGTHDRIVLVGEALYAAAAERPARSPGV